MGNIHDNGKDEIKHERHIWCALHTLRIYSPMSSTQTETDSEISLAVSTIETTFNHGGGLIDLLLQEQQQLSAVEDFSQVVDECEIPAQAKYYSKLLPASSPGVGQQYAFEVDLDRCSGCKACVVACHTMNGLDDEETWRDVGLLIGGTTHQPVMQHVTTACHHCVEPACMSACPVDAYEKNPQTGIVIHLDDQCFGCQYCTLACPYDVPKYQSSRGIVRKCDMCSDRLAVGEAPACVQSCPHEAIAIKIVDVDRVIEDTEADPFLPAAPEPHLTFPTTSYKTKKVFPRNMLPADYYSVSPQHPHWPLIIMLVLTQLSVGAFVVGHFLNSTLSESLLAEFRPIQASSALLFGLLALVSSTMHLGRPLYAFRAFIGLRHSWLSREILAFGLFAKLAMLFALLCWLPSDFAWLPRGYQAVIPIFSWGVMLSGAAGIFCSVMLYVFTKREFWNFGHTMIRFFLTGSLLGLTATWLSILLIGQFTHSATAAELIQQQGIPLTQAIIVIAAMKLSFELSIFRHLASIRNTPMKRSSRLMAGPLSNITFPRFASGFLGGIVLPAMVLSQLHSGQQNEFVLVIMVSMIFVSSVVGELLERYLFFAAVATARMPGGVRT